MPRRPSLASRPFEAGTASDGDCGRSTRLPQPSARRPDRPHARGAAALPARPSACLIIILIPNSYTFITRTIHLRPSWLYWQSARFPLPVSPPESSGPCAPRKGRGSGRDAESFAVSPSRSFPGCGKVRPMWRHPLRAVRTPHCLRVSRTGTAEKRKRAARSVTEETMRGRATARRRTAEPPRKAAPGKSARPFLRSQHTGPRGKAPRKGPRDL